MQDRPLTARRSLAVASFSAIGQSMERRAARRVGRVITTFKFKLVETPWWRRSRGKICNVIRKRCVPCVPGRFAQGFVSTFVHLTSIYLAVHRNHNRCPRLCRAQRYLLRLTVCYSSAISDPLIQLFFSTANRVLRCCTASLLCVSYHIGSST